MNLTKDFDEAMQKLYGLKALNVSETIDPQWKRSYPENDDTLRLKRKHREEARRLSPQHKTCDYQLLRAYHLKRKIVHSIKFPLRLIDSAILKALLVILRFSDRCSFSFTPSANAKHNAKANPRSDSEGRR